VGFRSRFKLPDLSIEQLEHAVEKSARDLPHRREAAGASIPNVPDPFLGSHSLRSAAGNLAVIRPTWGVLGPTHRLSGDSLSAGRLRHWRRR